MPPVLIPTSANAPFGAVERFPHPKKTEPASTAPVPPAIETILDDHRIEERYREAFVEFLLDGKVTDGVARDAFLQLLDTDERYQDAFEAAFEVVVAPLREACRAFGEQPAQLT